MCAERVLKMAIFSLFLAPRFVIDVIMKTIFMLYVYEFRSSTVKGGVRLFR